VFAKSEVYTFVWLLMRSEKLGIGHLRAVVSTSDRESPDVAHHCIVVTDGVVTPSARRASRTDEGMPEIFTLDELRTNRVRHAMQPAFRALSLPELEGVKRSHHVASETSFPVMFRSDYVARYYAWPVGTVVECTRSYGGAFQKTYRRVVKD